MQTPVSPVSPTEPDILAKPKPLRKEARDMLSDLAFRKQSPSNSPSLAGASGSPGTPRRRRLQKTPSPDIKSVVIDSKYTSYLFSTCITRSYVNSREDLSFLPCCHLVLLDTLLILFKYHSHMFCIYTLLYYLEHLIRTPYLRINNNKYEYIFHNFNRRFHRMGLVGEKNRRISARYSDSRKENVAQQHTRDGPRGLPLRRQPDGRLPLHHHPLAKLVRVVILAHRLQLRVETEETQLPRPEQRAWLSPQDSVHAPARGRPVVSIPARR